MTILQLIMLGGSGYFAFKIYEHIQTLKDPQNSQNNDSQESGNKSTEVRTMDSFSTFDSSNLLEKADEERENKNYEKAVTLYREAEIKDPKNAEILFKMGITLSLVDREEEALEYLEESIEVDKGNPFAYIEVAKLYEKLGDKEKADMYTKKAADLDANI